MRGLLPLAYAFDLFSSAAYVDQTNAQEQAIIFTPFVKALPLMRALLE
jgi:hypothetical protein